MSKDFTIFVVDLSPSMAKIRLPYSSTDLTRGLTFYHDFVLTTLLKGRKMDRIALVLNHSKVTDNPHADQLSLQRIQVLFKDEQFTYDQAKSFQSLLVPNMDPVEEHEGDCLEACMVAVGIFKDTMKYKYKRRIVVISNLESKINSFESPIVQAAATPIKQLEIEFNVIAVNLHLEHSKPPSWSDNESKWRKQIEFYLGNLYDSTSVNLSILYSPSLKKVKPVVIYTGPLTFGGQIKDPLSELEAEEEQSLIRMIIKLFPAVKKEKLISGHIYDIGGSIPTRVKYDTTYYIEEQVKSEKLQDEKKFIKREVEKHDWDSGFKYSNMDLIAVDTDLSKKATLQSFPGIDILCFIRESRLPMAYYMDESYYMFSEASEGAQNSLFKSFCLSLLRSNSIALARTVLKQNSQISICGLRPAKFYHEGKEVYGLFVTALAFKEDEKVGRFPSLTKAFTTDGKIDETEQDDDVDLRYDADSELGRLFPDESANCKMREFIRSKSLDEPIADKQVIRNKKIGLKETPFIDHAIDSGDVTSSPAIHAFDIKLKTLITRSLDGDLDNCLKDKNFVTHNLFTKREDSYEEKYNMEVTNFFNLYNVMNLDPTIPFGYLLEKNEQSLKHAMKLIDEIGVRYVPTSESKDEASERHQYEGEGKFDEAFDIDVLLNE